MRYRNSRRNRAKGRVGQLRVLGPGFNIIMPGIDHLAKTHVRERVVNLGDEEITLKDMTVFTVDGVLVYRVGDKQEDIYKALFEVENLENAVRLYCISILREVVREMTYEQLIGGEPEQIAAKLTERVDEQLAAWGLIVKSFGLGDLSPYGDTLRMIQTPAAAKLKVNALKEVAADVRGLELDPRIAAALVGGHGNQKL
ncbi:MAG TPA: SPFH domain-containing protein [Candidatus Saccharimonadales bacterium]|nr:SPFH domain-containing protein [Candidatus Saccharimonadales bacterium]